MVRSSHLPQDDDHDYEDEVDDDDDPHLQAGQLHPAGSVPGLHAAQNSRFTSDDDDHDEFDNDDDDDDDEFDNDHLRQQSALSPKLSLRRMSFLP